LFISDLCQLDIFAFKVDRIINRLIEPLLDNSNWPQLHCNRLLLVLSLTKLLKTRGAKGPISLNIDWCTNSQALVQANIKKILEAILTETRRKIIQPELPENNHTLRFGTSGIAWIYKQLWLISEDEEYFDEVRYWNNLVLDPKDVDKRFVGFDLKSENSALGILEGLTGIGLLNYTSSFL